jgi:hypothetical protein
VPRFTEEDDALLEELGVATETQKQAIRTPREERIIAGFEELQRFVEEHGHAPQHGEGRDIFERLYAVRIDRLRELHDCRALLEPLDHQRLLAGAESAPTNTPDELDDDELLAQLGVEAVEPADITELRHVRSVAEKRAAEEITSRQKCGDFDSFKPLFEQVQKELGAGLRQTRRFERKSEIAPGRFYILGRPESICRGNGRALQQRAREGGRPTSGDFRQRDREQPPHAVPSESPATGPRRPADRRALARPVVC